MNELTNMVKREKPILELVKQGKNREEIALELGLTRGAVRRFFMKYKWQPGKFYWLLPGKNESSQHNQ